MSQIEPSAVAAEELRAQLAALESCVPGVMIYRRHISAGPTRHFVYLSANCEEITGLPREAIFADPNLLYALILPEFGAAVDNAERRARADVEPMDIEFAFRHAAKGDVRRVRLRSCPRRHDDGSLTWDGVVMDITDAHLARERLLAREAELALVQRIGGVAGVDVDLREGGSGGCPPRYVRSPEYLQLHGLSFSSAVETREAWLARIHPDDRAAADRGFHAAVASGAAEYTAEYRIIRPVDGRERWLAVKAQIEHAEDGSPLRMIGAHIDITERKQAELALQKLNESLETAVEERTAQLLQFQKLETLGQLTGGVAHDFNNLLMAILGSLELVRRRMSGDARVERLLDNAMQGARRGTALTRRLLAFARRQVLTPRPVDVPELIEGMRDLLFQSLGTQVTLDFDFGEGLPPAQVDPGQLELAILNLVVNARDALPNGGRVRIAAAPYLLDGRRAVVVHVTDNGAGMDTDVLARAAEPFFTTKGPGKGTGLGLSMIHGLAAQSGGRLLLQSEPGEGTTASIVLPAATEAPPPVVVERVEAVERRGRELLAHGRTVLAVDDDPLVLDGLCAMLEDMGHRVLRASSGAEALVVLDREPEIALVVTDHAMPGMTGAALASTLAGGRPDLPVLIVSGYADVEAVLETDRPRLWKPFGRDRLARAVDSLLTASPARRTGRDGPGTA